MKCPHCKANLSAASKGGGTLLRSRGVILKGDSLAIVCPKCKGDVPLGLDAMNAVHRAAVLFFEKR